MQYAMQEVEALSLKQMLDFGRGAWKDGERILRSARYVQREVRTCMHSPNQVQMATQVCRWQVSA